MSNKNQKHNNKLVSRNEAEDLSFSSFVAVPQVAQKIEDVLGKKGVQRFISAVTSAVGANSQLSKCTNNSILKGALQGEALGLSPSPQIGHYYLVPFGKDIIDNGKKKRIYLAEFIVGYKGLKSLAIKSGYYRQIRAIAIKEGELTSYNAITGSIELDPITDPLQREQAPTAGFYGFYETTSGYYESAYWSRERMQKHAETYSKGYHSKSSPWQKHFDAMGEKTIIRHLLSKGAPLSSEMRTALETDNTVDTGTLEKDAKQSTVAYDADYTEVTPADAEAEIDPATGGTDEDSTENAKDDDFLPPPDDSDLPFPLNDELEKEFFG